MYIFLNNGIKIYTQQKEKYLNNNKITKKKSYSQFSRQVLKNHTAFTWKIATTLNTRHMLQFDLQMLIPPFTDIGIYWFLRWFPDLTNSGEDAAIPGAVWVIETGVNLVVLVAHNHTKLFDRRVCADVQSIILKTTKIK